MAATRFSREVRSASWPKTAEQLVAEGGVSRYELRGRSWRQSTRGLYVPSSDRMQRTTTQRIVEAAPLVSSQGALGGWAAAFVEGVDQLDGLDPFTMRELPILLYRGSETGRVSRAGITNSRDRLPTGDVITRYGISMTTPLRTGFDGARRAENVTEAVAFVDAMAHAARLTVGRLAEYVDDHPGWRGVEQARLACRLADAAARSTWESRFRVLYMLEAGLPRPLVNIAIFDRSGRLVGIADLLDLNAGLVSEFDGQGHRDREQHRADNEREEAFESLGLTVVRGDSLDMTRHRPGLIRRLVRGYERGMTRDRDRDAWTTAKPAWWRARDDEDELTDQLKDELFG